MNVATVLPCGTCMLLLPQHLSHATAFCCNSEKRSFRILYGISLDWIHSHHVCSYLFFFHFHFQCTLYSFFIFMYLFLTLIFANISVILISSSHLNFFILTLLTLPTEPSDGDLHGRLPALPPEYSRGHPVPATYLDCGHCRHLGVAGNCRLVLFLCEYSSSMTDMTCLFFFTSCDTLSILALKVETK